jgi:hypothetical protein
MIPSGPPDPKMFLSGKTASYQTGKTGLIPDPWLGAPGPSRPAPAGDRAFRAQGIGLNARDFLSLDIQRAGVLSG